MEMLSMFQKAHRVRRFVIVQFIALVGWIIVQSSFSLSPAGSKIPFSIMIVSETIWWIALLVIMLFMFSREYERFAQSAVELEEANRQLREVTNRIFAQKVEARGAVAPPALQEEVVDPALEQAVEEKLPEDLPDSLLEVAHDEASHDTSTSHDVLADAQTAEDVSKKQIIAGTLAPPEQSA